jgi:hypothetical protein
MKVATSNVKVPDNTESLDMQMFKTNPYEAVIQVDIAAHHLFTPNTLVNTANITSRLTTHAQTLHVFLQHFVRPTLHYLVDCHLCLVFSYLRDYTPPPPPPLAMSPTMALGTLK